MPEHLLDIAEELLNTPDTSQARLRSIVNRSYYAAFLTARKYCDSHEIETGFGASHEKVINALLDNSNLARQGKQLDNMKLLRHQADYRWQRDISFRDAKRAYSTCRELVAFFTS